MKRIEEAKQLLMGPEHVPESIIKGLFTKKESVVESVISEPEEKKRKLETTSNLTFLNENELEEILENEVSAELFETKVCPALVILQKKRLLELCVAHLESHEDLVLSQVIIPMMSTEERISNIPGSLLQHLKPASQKSVLNTLVNQTNPHWQTIEDLSGLDSSDGQVQTNLAVLFSKQTDTKDTKMSKFMLSLIKNMMQSNMDPKAYELWRQVVQMNNSFLKKSCEKELNKFNH